MQIIKWSTEAYFEQSITLDNKVFMFVAMWNTRDETWNVSLYKSDETPIIQGRRLVINEDVLEFVDDTDKPNGYLAVVAITANTSIITRDNMGIDVELFYIGKDEVL